MAKKKKEEVKEEVPQKPNKIQLNEGVVEIEKFSISELLEKNEIKPRSAVGFLEYFGLTGQFKKEFETGEVEIMFSEGEFDDMFERYMKREI